MWPWVKILRWLWDPRESTIARCFENCLFFVIPEKDDQRPCCCVLFWFPQIWDNTKPLETPVSADMIRGTPRRAVILERNKGTPKKPCFTMSRNVKPNTKTTSPVEIKLQFLLRSFLCGRALSSYFKQNLVRILKTFRIRISP